MWVPFIAFGNNHPLSFDQLKNQDRSLCNDAGLDAFARPLLLGELPGVTNENVMLVTKLSSSMRTREALFVENFDISKNGAIFVTNISRCLLCGKPPSIQAVFIPNIEKHEQPQTGPRTIFAQQYSLCAPCRNLPQATMLVEAKLLENQIRKQTNS